SEVDGWRAPQKPEGPSGHRSEDWTRRKELLFPDAGIMVRDHKIRPDTRLAGSAPCLTNRSSPRPTKWLTSGPSYEGFGRRAFGGALGLGAGPASESLVRRKPRGGRGAVWLGGAMGILGSRRDRPCGGGGGRRSVL